MSAKVDSIINDAIKQKAFPGCQVYASVDGKVIYNKSFGYTTYADTQAVENDMIYDIASMTKIDATALAAMWLYDHHLLDLKQTVAYYLPDYEKTNKGSLTVEQLMTHTAGLQAWIPFYKEGLTKNGTMMKKYFSSSKHDDYTVQITDSLFMNPKFYSKIDKQIKESPLTEKGKYVYSDLGMLLLQKIIERQAGKKMDVLLNEEFYQPLGLSHLLFNPRSKLALKILYLLNTIQCSDKHWFMVMCTILQQHCLEVWPAMQAYSAMRRALVYSCKCCSMKVAMLANSI